MFRNCFFIVCIILFLGCEDDDEECTTMVNLPTYNSATMQLEDNYQEVPCDLGEPVTEPVN